MKQTQQFGFTLIELSIVLVIMGLIVGSVLASRELVEAAKIRQQVSQLETLSAALNTFRIKYNAIPGDFCADAPSTGLYCGSLNGPANAYGADNGVINDDHGATLDSPDLDGYIPGVPGFHDVTYEPLSFFGQLVDANLLESRFTCPPYPPGTQGLPTMGNYALALNPAASMIAGTHQGVIWLFMGTVPPCGLGFYPSPVMTPVQAFALDQKIDDGVPGTGNFYATTIYYGQIQGAVDTSSQCVTDNTAQQYDMTNSTNQCSIMAKIQ